MSAPVRAVHAALFRAKCRGALVVAAAGNDPTLEGRSGPMLPAGWARLPNPTATQCECIQEGCERWPLREGEEGDDDSPFVASVGGVDLLDQPLPVSRRGSQGDLVAPAALVPAKNTYTNSTEVRSGTSIASVRVAATAALLWGQRPGLAGHRVLEYIYQSGVPLQIDANICPRGQHCREVHRLSVCDALGLIGVLSRCTPAKSAYSSQDWNNFIDAMNTQQLLTHFGSGVPQFFATSATIAAQNPACGTHTLSITSTVNYPCPSEQVPPAALWPDVGPQPEDPMCPSCAYSSSGEMAYVAIDGQAPQPYGAVLYLAGSQGSVAYDLFNIIGAQHWGPGMTAVIKDLIPPGPVDQAWIEFVILRDGVYTSHLNPVIVAD